MYQNGMNIKLFDGIPEFYTDRIPFRHGFSTRLGGVSTETGFESLDLGAGSNVNEIYENRRRFCRSFGVSPDRLFSARQIHSTDVKYVAEDDLGKYFECDGFVTDKRNLLLTVKTADCVPILLADDSREIIGAIHAGWRGTVAGIADNAVSLMLRHGACSENIKAVIGPSIHSCCYEVDGKFVDAVEASPCASICLRHIFPRTESLEKEKYLADLQGMNKDILINAGICPENITISGMCTCCGNALLFSHRGGKGIRGLMMAGIVL